MAYFLLPRFLRHLGPDQTHAYLTAKGVSTNSIDWESPPHIRAIAVLAQLRILPLTLQDQIESDFQKIDRLANDMGVNAIIEEADRMGIMLGTCFTALQSNHDRIMFAWLQYPQIWRRSRRLSETANAANAGTWYERSHVPSRIPNSTPEACSRLGHALSLIFSRQLRGQQYHVEPMQQKDGCWYYHIQFNDLPTTSESFMPGGSETTIAIIARVFEVILCIPANGGSMACYIQGGADRDLREKVFAACSQEILDTPLAPLPRNHPLEERWELDHLLCRRTLPVDPNTGAEMAMIRQLWVTANGQIKREGMFKADPDNGPEDIFDQLDTWLNQTQLPMSALHVCQVDFSLFWPVEHGKRRPCLNWTVAKPGICTLKSEREDRRRVGEAHLRLWRVDVIRSADHATNSCSTA